jgi:hypothetical protein
MNVFGSSKFDKFKVDF